MNLDDQVPIFIRHILETNIPQDTSIIKKYVYAAELLDCCFYYSFPILNTVVIRDSFASCHPNLVDNDISRLIQVLAYESKLSLGVEPILSKTAPLP